MQQCRQLTDAALRVACYDAITLPAAAQQVVRPAPIAATPAVVLPAPAAPAIAAFGLPAAPVKPAAAAAVPDALDSRISGAFEGWQAQTRVRLANGQVWQISDGSEGAYTLREPKVRVTRGSFGGYFMHIEGVSQIPRVRRVE